MKSRKISIYPYACLSIRIAYLNYSKPQDINSSYTNISNLVNRDQSAKLSSTKLGYQVGLGFDYVLGTDKDKTTKFILFTKIATDNPIGTDKYKINGVEYKPEIRHGDWLVTVGIKFANPR